MEQPRSLWLIVFTLLLAIMAAPRPSSAADDIETITLGPEGPDKQVPLGTPFYLQGAIEGDKNEVYVVIVRTSWPLFNLWSPDEDRCSDLQKLDAPPKLASSKRHTTTKTLWANDKGWDEPTLVLGPWTQTDATQKQYKVLVPSDSLFRPGASYCVLSYLKKTVTTNDVVKFSKHLLELGQNVKHCLGKDDYTAAEELTCTNKEADKVVEDLKKDFKDIPEAQTKDAWNAIRGAQVKLGSNSTGLVDAALTFALKSSKISNITGSWRASAAHGPDGSFYPLPVPRPPPRAQPVKPGGKPPPLPAAVAPNDESFGIPFMLAEQLAAKAELGRLEPGPGFAFAGGVVKRLAMKGDHTFAVEIEPPSTATDPTPKLAIQPLPFPAASVLLPDSQLSVEDALNFADGRIKIGSEYVRISTLAQGPLAQLQPSQDGTFSQTQLNDVTSVRAAFEAWHDFFKQVENATKNPGDLTNNARALRALTAHAPIAQVTALRDTVSTLTSLLKDYERSQQAWNASPQVIRETTKIKFSTLVAYRADRRAGLTQERWFDTYFTPVVGRAMVFGDSARFGEWYTGVQVFAYANAVNEPMWTNGSDDFRRFLGIELAALAKTGTFGPNDRFSRDPDVGLAWMFGLVLQPLPYTTVSFGKVWISERESRIAAENPHTHLSWYLGLAVQANVPGIIRTIAAPSSAQTNGAH